LIAAAYSGSNVTVPDFEYGKTNTSPCFLKKFPLGKVPAFESNGVFLNESDAISQYVSNDALLGGTDAASRAAVQEYMSFTESEIVPSACTWVFPTLGFTQYNKQETENAMNHLRNCFAKLNNDLLTKTFLVGERVTLADITLATALVMLYVQVLDDKFRASFGNLNRWFLTCINQPNFKKVLGDIKLCETMAVFDKKRYAELQKKTDTKPKKQEKAKEQTAKEPKAPEPPKEAKVDYFADVPKSDFVLLEWKEMYGKGTVEESQKHFAEKFDDKAWSVWHGVKPEEKTTCSRIGSYLQGTLERLGSVRKFMHAMFLIHERKEGDCVHFTLSTVIICKGTSLIFDRNDDWSTDSCYFDWKKVETKEARQELLNQYFYQGVNKEGVEAITFENFT